MATATLKFTTGAQYVQEANFIWDNSVPDSMIDTSGNVTQFNATTGVFDAIPLPYGSEVVGGMVETQVVSNDAGTATVSVGDSALTTRYITTTDVKTALASAALVPTGRSSLGEPIRITVANNTGGATTGKIKVRVLYVVTNRVSENLKTK